MNKFSLVHNLFTLAFCYDAHSTFTFFPDFFFRLFFLSPNISRSFLFIPFNTLLRVLCSNFKYITKFFFLFLRGGGTGEKGIEHRPTSITIIFNIFSGFFSLSHSLYCSCCSKFVMCAN